MSTLTMPLDTSPLGPIEGASEPPTKRTSIHRFKGRIGCRTYATRSVLVLLVFVVGFIGIMIGATLAEDPNVSQPAVGVVSVVSALVLFYAAYIAVAAGVQRLHDLDKSGWYYLITVIPVVGVVYWLYMSFKIGSEDENRFGKQGRTSVFDTYFGPVALVLVVLIAASTLVDTLTSIV